MSAGTQRGLAPVRYVFDKAASRFTVQAFATGMLSVLGHNPTIAILDFEGDVQFVPGTYEKAVVRVSVNTTVLDVVDEMKKDDLQKLERLMHQEVLESDRFPSALYQSKQIDVQKTDAGQLFVEVGGELTLHGVTKNHSFTAQVRDFGTMLRISGKFSLRQSDYNIKPVSIAGGTLRLKDELNFNMEIAARLRE